MEICINRETFAHLARKNLVAERLRHSYGDKHGIGPVSEALKTDKRNFILRICGTAIFIPGYLIVCTLGYLADGNNGYDKAAILIYLGTLLVSFYFWFYAQKKQEKKVSDFTEAYLYLYYDVYEVGQACWPDYLLSATFEDIQGRIADYLIQLAMEYNGRQLEASDNEEPELARAFRTLQPLGLLEHSNWEDYLGIPTV